MYLACNVIKRDFTLSTGDHVNGVVYDMEPFLEQCVARYLEVAGAGVKMRLAKTPFLIHDSNKSDFRNPLLLSGPGGCTAPRHG